MTEPLWTGDGTAYNTEAALADALLWLRLFAKLLATQPSIDMIQRSANLKRLRMCIEQAKEFLPDDVTKQAPDSIL